jgi:phage-related baseplate assembly protein
MTEALPEYFRLIDLSTVPVPDFVEALDYEAIRQSAINFFVSLDPAYTALLESDPAIKIIEAFAYREMILRQRVNDAARASTITGAQKNDLAVIGALFGVTPLGGEKDEAFRRRVQLGIYKASVAGPRQAYQYHALSAHPNIVDAAVHSPDAGEIAITILAFEDVEATEATPEEVAIGKALFAQPIGDQFARILARSDSGILKAVRAATTGEDVRPLTDSVVVQPPTVKTFTIAAKLIIYPGPDAATVRTAAVKSLSAYLQRIRRISYDATRSGIIAALSVGGVQNVILEAPVADVDASFYDLPVCVSATVEVERVDV